MHPCSSLNDSPPSVVFTRIIQTLQSPSYCGHMNLQCFVDGSFQQHSPCLKILVIQKKNPHPLPLRSSWSSPPVSRTSCLPWTYPGNVGGLLPSHWACPCAGCGPPLQGCMEDSSGGVAFWCPQNTQGKGEGTCSGCRTWSIASTQL